MLGEYTNWHPSLVRCKLGPLDDTRYWWSQAGIKGEYVAEWRGITRGRESECKWGENHSWGHLHQKHVERQGLVERRLLVERG